MIARALQSMRSRPVWLVAGLSALLYLPMFAVISAVTLRSTELSMAISATPGTGPDVAAVLAMMRAMPWLALAGALGSALGLPAYVFVEVGVALHTRALFDGVTLTSPDLFSAIKAVYVRGLATYFALYGPLLLVYALLMLLVGLAGEGFILGLIDRGDSTGVLVSAALTGVVSIALLIGAFVAFVSAIFSVRAVALDGAEPLPAIRWSLGIVRHVARRMAVMYLMIYLVQMALSMIVSLVTTPVMTLGVFIMMARAPLASPEAMTAAITRDMQILMVPMLFVSILSAVPMMVFVSAAWTAFYQRVLGRPLSPAPLTPVARHAPSASPIPVTPAGQAADA
jgi:hypothetical protein